MEQPPQSAPPDGAGLGTFLLAFLLIVAAGGGIWLHQQGRLMPLLSKKPPEPEFTRAPVRPLAPPRKMPSPRKPVKDGAKVPRGSLGYVNKNKAVVGVADQDGDYDETLARMTSEARLSAMMAADRSVSMTGDGGPARFEGRLIRSRSRWHALWREVRGHDIPDLNFSKKMGVVVFAGRQPAGSTIEIVSTAPSGRVFLVKYRIRRPRKKLRGRRARPYNIRVVPTSRLRPVFRKVR